jgi:hypothetical protein
MQQLKELEQFNEVYKKHKKKRNDKLKTGNKLSPFKNQKTTTCCFLLVKF